MDTTKSYSCISSTYDVSDVEHPDNQLIDQAREAVVKGRCKHPGVIDALDALEEYWEEETGDGSVGSVERMRSRERDVVEAWLDASEHHFTVDGR